MGFAPLDVWVRLLFTARREASIPLLATPRILGNLFTSTLGTALTLPERLLLAPLLHLRHRQTQGTLDHRPASAAPGSPGVIVILGYYRSGTTHLHYLLSCDPRVVTPRWHQVLAPCGFVASWAFLRLFLVPFLSSTRPQDDVAYGPDYPAEDDFAVCNWTLACSMPGRMVVPQRWNHFGRLHALTEATPRELERFRFAQRAFVQKLAWLNPSKLILLKTPAHTARLNELRRMFGPSARFIHLSRPAEPVVKSNVAMHGRFTPFLLQPSPGEDIIRERVVAEYDLSERLFLEQATNAPPGIVAQMRYQDLIADPIGELHRVYAELGLKMTDETGRRLVRYLDSVRDYRTASDKAAKSETSPSGPTSATTPLPHSLAWMHERFGHDQPAVPKREPRRALADLGFSPPPEGPPVLTNAKASIRAGIIASVAAFILWLAIAYLTRNRHDAFIWPVGVLVGLCMLRASGRGNARLGLVAGSLTLAVMILVSFPGTFLAEYRDRNPTPWYHVWLSTRRGLLAWNNAAWVGLGVMTAFRFASRQHVRPPGA